VISLALMTYAAWLVILFFLQRSILFPRMMANAHYAPAPPWIDRWELSRPDGVTASGLFVRAKESERAPVIVLLHGNAMLAEDWIDWANELSKLKVHVLIPEFRGYGASQGTPSREALVGDTAAMIESLAADPRVEASAIMVYGRSIGGAIAAEAVAKLKSEGRPLAAELVLHTAPARIADLSWRFAAPPFLLRDPFDALTAVTTLRGTTALTVIGHIDDEIVPASDAGRLAAAGGVNAVMLAGTHNRFGSGDADDSFHACIGEAIDRLKRRRSGSDDAAHE
jgi:pimeloyl-ACP methyl ester carboxylesterase